jgi:hypothetical protein
MQQNNTVEYCLSIPIEGIKYKKSTIRNQSIIQKYFFSPMGPQRGDMNKKTCFKKGWFFQN